MSNPTSLHLCAGIGLGMLSDVWSGGNPVGAVEICPRARAVIAKRFPTAKLHGDLREFNKSEEVDAYKGVDLVAAGFPCQSISSAGKQESFDFGSSSKSALVWDVLRTINVVRPKHVLLENVANILNGKHRHNLDLVLGELGHMGYGGVFGIFSSGQMGASHLRRRFWLLAERGRSGWTHHAEEAVVDTYGFWPTPRVGGRGTFVFRRNDGKVRDDLETVAFMTAIMRETGLEPLSLSRDEVKAVIGRRRLNPRWVEWHMGAPLGYADLTDSCEVPPGVRLRYPPNRWAYARGAAGLLFGDTPTPLSEPGNPGAANASLRQLGNAQDPIAATHAFQTLKDLLK